MNKHTILYRTLARALSIKRPHNTIGTHQITRWLIDHLPDGVTHRIDGTGNLHVDTRKTQANRTLFVAHVDTVHRVTGPNKIRKTQHVWYAHADSPLGADDGAGCAMLMHLLCGGVPAYYIFTQGEECGGIGAKAVAEDTKLLAQFDRAIAFDRKGIDSVITHQGMGRCCSDAFANALSAALGSDDRLMYSPDDTGVYTDTAEFVDVIPECTNVSVGYYSEHTSKESLDVLHLQTLADVCLRIDWDSLPTERDPSVVENKWDSWYAWGTQGSINDWTYPSRYDDYDKMDLRLAIQDALTGNYEFLIDLMAESVWPDEPSLAVKFIDTRGFTEDALLKADELLDTYDCDTVLGMLFDETYCEA